MRSPNRDHLGLLCDVGELTARLAGSSDIESFLTQVVQMVAEHMASAVCSIYLYEEQADELALRANCGLHPDSVSRVRMKASEGLTGLSLRELRPIREDHASANPNFKGFGGINEEPYESFLAVPILKGVERLGVLVVQREQRMGFTDSDAAALTAIASQLAGAIENARTVLALRTRAQGVDAAPRTALPSLVRGRAASRGVALGPAAVTDTAHGHWLFSTRCFLETYTLDDFRGAVTETGRQLEEMQKAFETRLPEMASMIFDAHLMMLKDPAFTGEIEKRIAEGVNPPEALLALGHHYVDLFAASTHAYMREKAHDVEDLVRRLLHNLTGGGDDGLVREDCVVIARTLYPSDILKLASANVRGAIVITGGAASHVAILARSLHLPLLIADDPHLLEVPDGTPLLLDADAGHVVIQPSPDVLDRYRSRLAAHQQVETLPADLTANTLTRDGTRIRLLANINLLADLDTARRVGSEGVGLYRSEFPFLVRTVLPSEEEQYLVYRRLLDAVPDRPVTFRTLDVGSDKLLSYYEEGGEENPAMGLRSIRFSFRHRDVFRQQLRAMLRAAAEHPAPRIMFPLISSVEDIRDARRTLNECIEALRSEGLPHHAHPSVGIMLEVPAAVEVADALAREVDFFSVGTNDLIQFLLAVDRTNERVAKYFTPHHPAVLRALKRLADACLRHQRDISVCGEMAQQEQYVPFLIGIGVRSLSVDPQYIPALRRLIGEIDLPQASRLAADLLEETTLAGIESILRTPKR